MIYSNSLKSFLFALIFRCGFQYIVAFYCGVCAMFAAFPASAHSVESKLTRHIPNIAEQVFQQFLMEQGIANDHQRVPYTLTHPAFSNYSEKYRELRIPADAPTAVADIDQTKLPLHSVIVKIFFYRVKQSADCDWQDSRITAIFTDERTGEVADDGISCPVEVRILHLDSDGWRGHVYVPSATRDGVWESLSEGRKVRVTLSGGESAAEVFDYSIPSIGDCASCHFGSGGILPIGLADEKRIVWGSQSGVISTELSGNDYEEVDRERLARHYLDINCAHCHNKDGLAASSALYLDAEQPLGRHTGLCKPVVAAGRAFGGDAYSIKPGDAESSVVIKRMRSLTVGEKMPELGRAIVDNYGVQIVSDWINTLGGECE